MTRKYDDETGALKIGSDQIPVAKTYPEVESTRNKLDPRNQYFILDEIAHVSSDATFEIATPDKGKVVAVSFVNGSVAADGTNGLKIVLVNKTNADDVVASVGFGTGTNALTAVDDAGAVAAYANADKKVTDTSVCNKADVLLGTITRDGTTIVGTIKVEYQVSAEGRTA